MGTRKKLPFTLNRNDRRSLLAQVTDGLRMGIAQGYYAPGDIIPSTRGLASALGVSHIVTEAALRRLVAEGYVESRPRRGTVVRDRNAKQWSGHVVCVYEKGDDNYFQTMIAGAMRDRLTEAGYLFSMASVFSTADGKCDFSHLDVVLSRSVDFVLVMYHRPEIHRYLASRKIPFAVFGEKAEKPASAVGAIHLNYNLAMDEFALACRRAGVGEVVEVYWHRLMCDAAPALSAAGIRVKKVKAPVDESEGRLIGVKRAGRLAAEKMIKDWPKLKGQTSKRLYFFADDYLATGAILAFYRAGMEAPRDLLLATLANRGLGPDYHVSLSRMEIDPAGAAVTVANAVLTYCRTGAFPDGLAVGPKWIDGGTMKKPE